MGEEITNHQTSKEIMEILLCCYRQNSIILDRFVGFIVLQKSQEKNRDLIIELNSWGYKYNKDYDDLLEKIKETLDNYQPHLVLAISKGTEKKDSNKYIAEAWLIENINDKNNEDIVPHWEPLKIEGNLVYYFNRKPTKKGIIKVLKSALESFNNREYKSRYLEQIQIFLPYELINDYPIDSYEILVDKKKKIKIGKRYQVVMRYSERLKEEGDKFCIRKWQNKAEQIKLKMCAKKVFNSANNEDLEFLESKFQIQDEREQKNQIIAVKRTTGFPEKKKEKDFLTLLFNCSIPIALWVRQEIQDAEAQIKTFWEEKSLKDIPIEVKLKRMEAPSQNNTTHIGHHLCLLWDFPHFLPPKHKRSHPRQPLTEINL